MFEYLVRSPLMLPEFTLIVVASGLTVPIGQSTSSCFGSFIGASVDETVKAIQEADRFPVTQMSEVSFRSA